MLARLQHIFLLWMTLGYLVTGSFSKDTKVKPHSSINSISETVSNKANGDINDISVDVNGSVNVVENKYEKDLNDSKNATARSGGSLCRNETQDLRTLKVGFSTSLIENGKLLCQIKIC